MTHVVSIQPTGRETPGEQLSGGRIAVYGKADLDDKKAAARKAGRNITVRKLGPEDS
jgi:hypothetical protein